MYDFPCQLFAVYCNIKFYFKKYAHIHLRTQKEISSQIDKYLVILSSKTCVFEDNMIKYQSV